MNGIVIFSALLACAAAFPGYYLHETPVVHTVHAVPLTKSTITKSSQLVNHGSTDIYHPIVHHAAPVFHAIPQKSTISQNSQVVNHGSTHVYHPVVHHTPLIHAEPLSKSTITKTSQVVSHGSTDVYHPIVHHAPVVHHAPLVTLKTGDSAISQSSQSVHETVPLVSVYHH